MQIKEIKVDRFPVVIITDSHCHIKRISEIKSIYPHSQFICLGDITDLFSYNDAFNKHSIDYFIENKIPCLEGNHESFIKACYSGDGFTLSNVLVNVGAAPTYRLDEAVHIAYLKTLPTGFKVVLPSGEHYLCFHHEPNNLWNFNDKNGLSADNFKKIYPIDDKTLGVVHGHTHKAFLDEYDGVKAKRYSVGALKFKQYAILTEQGIHFKSL
jgi:predicted phosphodiesterase